MTKLAIDIHGYCLTCKAKGRKMESPELKMINKTNRPAASGKCAVCGKTMYKILTKAERASCGLP